VRFCFARATPFETARAFYPDARRSKRAAPNGAQNARLNSRMARKGAVAKKEKKANGEKGGKRRRKARTDSYASYIYKVLKQVTAGGGARRRARGSSLASVGR